MQNPQAIKPGTYMPNLQLSANDVRALVAYMETLK
jgi:cytochrome c1